MKEGIKNMIYLKSKHLLFFKPKKVAGTSFEIALSHFSRGEEDIITPISIDDEYIRFKKIGITPQNWVKSPTLEKQYCSILKHLFKTAGKENDQVVFNKNSLSHYDRLVFYVLSRFRYGLKYYNHITPQKINMRMGRQKMLDAFKVSIVRNPLDQLISYVFFIANNEGKTLKPETGLWHTYVQTHASFTNQNYYFSGDELLCNLYIQYEKMGQDALILKEKFDLDVMPYMIRTKHTQRKDRRDPLEILSPLHIKQCYEANKKVFEHFYPEALEKISAYL